MTLSIRALYCVLIASTTIIVGCGATPTRAPATPAAPRLELPTTSPSEGGTFDLVRRLCTDSASVLPKLPAGAPRDPKDLDIAALELLYVSPEAQLGTDPQLTLPTLVAPAVVLCAHAASPATLTSEDLAKLRELRSKPKALKALAVAMAYVKTMKARKAPTTPEEIREQEDTIQKERHNIVLELRRKGKSAGAESMSAAMPALGDFQSFLINGLADFVVDRAKADAIHYIRKHIGQTICKDKSGEAIIPETCRALADLDDSMSIQAMGAYLRAAALKDALELPERLIWQYGDPKTKPTSAILVIALSLERAVRAGRTPLEALQGLPEAVCASTTLLPQIRDAACLAGRIVRAIEAQPTWHEFADAPDSPLLALCVSLELDRLDPAADLSKFVTRAERLEVIVASAKRVRDLMRRIADPGPENKHGTKDYIQLLRESLALLAASAGLDGASEWSKATKVISLVQEFAGHIAAQDVSSAVVTAHAILSEISVDLAKVAPELASLVPVVVEFAQAKSSEEVVHALEAAAAPVGSYEARYQRPVMAITAMLGVAAGGEWDIAAEEVETAGTAGAFAPIGIHISGNLSELFYIGGFLSVIDIGTLATARLEEDTQTPNSGETTEIPPEAAVTFAQVFSPGLYLTVGLFGSPLALGGGVSLTPELRRAETTNGAGETVDEEEVTAVRVLGTLTFDITIYPF